MFIKTHQLFTPNAGFQPSQLGTIALTTMLCWMGLGSSSGVGAQSLLDQEVTPSIAQVPNIRRSSGQLFPDFRGTGRPGSHGGGASRGGCPDLDPEMQLLVPTEAGYGGYTTEATPTLWAYVPFTLNADSPITFSLLDEQGNSVYEAFQVVNHRSGILNLTLPSHITLEVGQMYEWYLMVHCNDPDGTDAASFASGWIERISPPSSVEAGTTLSPIELSDLYANQLIWYDALTVLGESLLENPNDSQLINAWTGLLSLPSVQLNEVSTAPLSDCCTLERLDADNF